MSERKISTHSVSRDVVETDPIVLRDGSTTRLVFLATMVGRDHPLRGCFVYQRKRKSDKWEDIRTVPLTSLKAGEGYVIELRSQELSTLMDGLDARKELFERHGIQWGDRDYVSKQGLPAIVQRIIDSDSTELSEALSQIDVEDVLALSQKVEVSKLDALLADMNAHGDEKREEYWQELLKQNAWVFAQITGSPVVLLEDKAYVGGKTIRNRDGGEVDYLLANQLTENVSFVEIKTPSTRICASGYRGGGVFALDKDISGGVVQVLGYKDNFEKEYFSHKAKNEDISFRSFNPRCWLIAGCVHDLSTEEKRSFELFRNAFAGVTILAFDEVISMLEGIRDALVADEPVRAD
ncbi:MAG: Shedu immune nuclease family protein [Solirubrobacteraceae bacterium]